MLVITEASKASHLPQITKRLKAFSHECQERGITILTHHKA